MTNTMSKEKTCARCGRAIPGDNNIFVNFFCQNSVTTIDVKAPLCEWCFAEFEEMLPDEFWESEDKE